MPAHQANDTTISASSPRPTGMKVRLRGVVVAAPILTISIIAAALHPDSRGVGTHEQLGLSPCTFLATTGWPCPTCGLTTSVSATVHGQLGRAFKAHAFGPLLVAAMAALLAASVFEVVTAKPVLSRIRWRSWWIWAGLAMLLGGWGLKALLGWMDGTYPIH